NTAEDINSSKFSSNAGSWKLPRHFRFLFAFRNSAPRRENCQAGPPAPIHRLLTSASATRLSQTAQRSGAGTPYKCISESCATESAVRFPERGLFHAQNLSI